MDPDETMFLEARNALENGERSRARDLLTRLLKENQKNAEYWLWLSAVVETKKERLYCLKEALKINPENLAVRRGLALMGEQPPEENETKISKPLRRQWQARLEEEPKAEKLVSLRSWKWMLVLIGGGLLFVALILFALFGPGKVKLPSFYTRQEPQQVKPSATYLPSPSRVVQTPTPTYIGAKPLWMFLSATYTPTPLYVNTPHPRTEAYRSGLRAFQRGEWANVVNFMQQLLTNESDALDAYYYIGEAYRMQGNYSQAIKFYNQAINLNHEFAPAFLGRARANLAAKPGNIKDVTDDLQRAISYDPNMVEAYLDLISIQLDNQDAKSALDLIGKVVVMAPDSPRVYLYRARALLLSGELEQALRDANQALALDATLLEAYRVDGQALQANGDLVSSIKPLSTYVQYATKDDEALVWLGKAYAANQQTDLALQSFSDAISVNNQQVDAYLARADIYQANQQPDLALQDYNSLLKFKQNTFDANMGRSLAMFNLGQYGDAYIQMNHSQALAENDDELARLFYWRSKTLEKLGKLSAAQKDWKALLQLPTAVVPADWAAYANQKLVTILTPYPVATLPGSSAATATTTGTKTP